MKPILLSIAAALALSTATFAFSTDAFAQGTQNPGAEFMTGWDTDGNGAVTLAEAKERRESIFAMFDANDDGQLSGDEFALIDEHKAEEAANGHGPDGHVQQGGSAQGQGMGQGMGKGHGQGQGKGKAQGNAMNQETPFGGFSQAAEQGMKGLDTNSDGAISAAEFVDGTPAWFQARDRNGDGDVTTADFGPQN